METIKPVNLPPQIFNQKGWIKLIDGSKLKDLFNELLAQSNFTVLNYSDHYFPLNGFTALWLLAESHLALHTFAESGWCYIELSSCNKNKAVQFSNAIKNLKFETIWDTEDNALNMSVPKTNALINE